MFLPHFDVICDLLLDRCTATWNLFVLYNKEINFVRILKAALFHVRRAKVGLPHPDKTRKKPFDAIYDLYKMKLSHWLLYAGKELWLVEANHATVKLDSSVASPGMKTYKEARIELQNYNSQRKSWKSRVSSAQWAEKLGCCLEYCRSWKLPIAVNLEEIGFHFWTERSVSDSANLCPLWSVILKSVWNSVGDNF